tara:strand:- start:504 stop:731 length:228 start_codon:yes stop_codon:yes gene_type:complete
MPSGDEHDPGDEFGSLRIESVSGLPESNENLLNSVLGFRLRGKQLPSNSENKSTEAVIQLGYGGLFACSDSLHEM